MSVSSAGNRWDLFWMLTRTEFRLRDQGTLAGFLWTLLHPLFIFSILYALFTRWMAPLVPNYAACLLIGIVQWNFFSTATTAGMTSLRRKAGLIASFSFPRGYVVSSSIAAVLLSHLLEWAVLLAALLVLGVRPGWSWLLLPALIAVEVALALGIASVLSVLAVDVRDLDHVWGLLLYGFFFLTPVFYTAEVVGEGARRLIAVNPLAVVIDATRAAVIGGAFRASPSIWLVAAGAGLFCAASVGLFDRMSRGISERL
ncbi:MAG: ABC transporter permease [Elusimicrobia bacterium]|nr:ABC transporter permease [Elusimicrobiota bacterium]